MQTLVQRLPETKSEKLFARYLDLNVRAGWEFEPEYPSRAKRPDFRIQAGGIDYLFELKERHGVARPIGVVHYDPYKAIRTLIHKAKRKFSDFEDFPCSLVIFNADDWSTLLEPRRVFAAMLGDLGVSVDLQTREATSVFLPQRGKMVEPSTGEYQNQTISAVIILEDRRLRDWEFESRLQSRIENVENQESRQLTLEKKAAIGFDLAREAKVKYERVPRVVVCENPGAARLIPRDLFSGSFDERHAIFCTKMMTLYKGISVRDLL